MCSVCIHVYISIILYRMNIQVHAFAYTDKNIAEYR